MVLMEKMIKSEAALAQFLSFSYSLIHLFLIRTNSTNEILIKQLGGYTFFELLKSIEVMELGASEMAQWI